MPLPCMCTLEVCAQVQGLCTSGAHVNTSTYLAGILVSHIFCAKVLSTSNPEKLGHDARAGCSSSGVCRLYHKSFLRVSRKSRETRCSFGGAAADPIALHFAMEGSARVNPDPCLILARLCRLPSLARGSWLPLPEVWGLLCFNSCREAPV